WPPRRPDHAPDRAAAGAQGHHAADHVQLSRPDQGFEPCRRHRLSGPRPRRQHHRQHDGAGLRGADHPDRRLSHAQPRPVGAHERLQQPRRAARGRAGMSALDVAPREAPPRDSFAGPSGPAAPPLGRRLAAGLFGTRLNTAITVATVALLAWAVPPFLRWALIDATWRGTSAECMAGEGACWAFVAAKLRFILFAFYPPDLH